MVRIKLIKINILDMNIMPCLFQGNQISGIHFPHFPMFGNHPES